ncbi:MAG: hypothetical protein KGL46_07990 [Hyphomicrobiales bacterium]|nr:hypothetical protein [Hyphomicrobiales bacterium]
MRNLLKSRFAEFRADAGGGMAVIMAVAAVPVLAMTGTVFEFSQLNVRRTDIQNAVDAAMLQTMATSTAQNDALARRNIMSRLTNIPDIAVSAEAISFQYTAQSGAMPAIYKATVPGTMTPRFLPKMLAATPFHVSSAVSSAAPPAASSAQFRVSRASGLYWKKVELFVHTVGAATDTPVVTYTYQLVDLTSWSGTVAIAYPDGTSGLVDSNGNYLSGVVNQAVSLGSNYDKVYLKTTISPTGCAPGYVADPTKPLTNITCIASGSVVKSTNSSLQNSDWYNLMDSFSSPQCLNASGNPTSGKCASYAYTITAIAPPTVFSTNDPATSNQLFVSQSAIPQPPTSAVQIPLGTTPSVSTLIPCGKTTYWALEDTAWKAAGLADSAWQTQDMFFTIQGVQCSATVAGAASPPKITN